MKVKIKQSLNEAGWAGACMFVLAPLLSAYLWMSSAKEYARQLDLSGAYSAERALYPPIIYILLSAISLIGIVLVIVGRDLSANVSETSSTDMNTGRDKRSEDMEWR